MEVRPQTLPGHTHKFSLGCGNVYIVVCSYEGKPVEVFMYMGKGGECAFAFSESVSRAVSQALRAGVDAEEVAKQQEGIKCPKGMFNGERGEHYFVNSCSDAIAKALREEIKGGQVFQIRQT